MGEQAQAFGISFGHVEKALTEALVICAGDRIAAGEIDVIREQHEFTLPQVQPDAAGGIGNHQGRNAQSPKDADRERDFFRRVSLVGVNAALHDRHWRFAMVTHHQASAMPLHSGARKVGNIRIGDDACLLDSICERAQARAENNGHPWAGPDALPYKAAASSAFSKMPFANQFPLGPGQF